MTLVLFGRRAVCQVDVAAEVHVRCQESDGEVLPDADDVDDEEKGEYLLLERPETADDVEEVSLTLFYLRSRHLL